MSAGCGRLCWCDLEELRRCRGTREAPLLLRTSSERRRAGASGPGLHGAKPEASLETDRPPWPLSPTVYCCCCLANVSLPGIGSTVPESKPFFYVNVADIESLEVEVSYVACEYGALPASCHVGP